MIKDSFSIEDKLILIPNFNTSEFRSHFFINSWVLSSELEDNKFKEKLEYLHQKDKEVDSNAENINYILVFDTKCDRVYLLNVSDFLHFNHQDRIKMFSTKFDFFVPRSLWFKAFTTLNKNILPN